MNINPETVSPVIVASNYDWQMSREIFIRSRKKHFPGYCPTIGYIHYWTLMWIGELCRLGCGDVAIDLSGFFNRKSRITKLIEKGN